MSMPGTVYTHWVSERSRAPTVRSTACLRSTATVTAPAAQNQARELLLAALGRVIPPQRLADEGQRRALEREHILLQMDGGWLVADGRGNVGAIALDDHLAGRAFHHRRDPAALRVRGNGEGGFGGLSRHGGHGLALKRAVGLPVKGIRDDAFFIHEEDERPLVGEAGKGSRLRTRPGPLPVLQSRATGICGSCPNITRMEPLLFTRQPRWGML